MPVHKPIARVCDLTDPEAQRLYGLDPDEARQCLLAEGAAAAAELEGSFALVAREGERVLLTRSLDRPLRYFLAKETDGPMLVVAERIDTIAAFLESEGNGDQFHPSYTRMVPAHHVTQLRLVGCPDPNPDHFRSFDPPRGVLPPDLDLIGERYVAAAASEIRRFLETLPDSEPLGVLFSGGADSALALLAAHHQLLALGQSPARLKAFTLVVGGGGADAEQALEVLRQVDLELLLETVEVTEAAIDPWRAIEVIEDYKPRDVECAACGLALLEAIRERYPDWRYLLDGDGGDENLKDYPIEENPELTIRSVVGNRMLYQEGWGVDKIKHSLTYSGGLSRGCVRTYAPASRLGFSGCSPLTRPAVVAIAEAIPFERLTEGSHERLYALKGEIVRRGVRRCFGVELPIFPKRRFQHGVGPDDFFAARFSVPPESYRRHFLSLYGG